MARTFNQQKTPAVGGYHEDLVAADAAGAAVKPYVWSRHFPKEYYGAMFLKVGS